MRPWQIALGAVAVFSLIAGFLVPHDQEHESIWWDAIGVFYGAFGFIGCVVIIFLSKALGKWILQKREDYYDG